MVRGARTNGPLNTTLYSGMPRIRRTTSSTTTSLTAFPTQKPLGIIKRIISVSSNPGDIILDFFAGSGTVGEAATMLGRSFILVDNNPEAIEVMRKRLSDKPVAFSNAPMPYVSPRPQVTPLV